MKLSRGVRTAQGFLIVSGAFLIIISILAAMFRAPIKDFFELIVGGILCLCIAHRVQHGRGNWQDQIVIFGAKRRHNDSEDDSL